MIKRIVRFFDKLEDKVRIRLSHFPIFYGALGGIGVVLFWRGVWHTGDFLTYILAEKYFDYVDPDINTLVWWDGPLSFVVGSLLLLVIGVFVSTFIGNEIIISGVRKQKKLAEKTEKEVGSETDTVAFMQYELKKIADKVDMMDKHFHEKNQED